MEGLTTHILVLEPIAYADLGGHGHILGNTIHAVASGAPGRVSMLLEFPPSIIAAAVEWPRVRDQGWPHCFFLNQYVHEIPIYPVVLVEHVGPVVMICTTVTPSGQNLARKGVGTANIVTTRLRKQADPRKLFFEYRSQNTCNILQVRVLESSTNVQKVHVKP